jgi:hypothetical protein
MKLVRYGQPGMEKPGLIDSDGKLRDLSGSTTARPPEAWLPLNQTRDSHDDPDSPHRSSYQ